VIDGQTLSDSVNKIQSLFGLQEQGRELITLVIKAIGCKYACLLFLDIDGEDFTVTSCHPKSRGNPLSSLRLSGKNPVVEYLRQDKKLLTRESLATLPDFRSQWEQDAGEIKLDDVELFMPLISRDRLIGILVLGEKKSGRYSLKKVSMLEDIADRVAVSMEKEYLREQLSEREKELSVINRSSAIITSSLDIQRIFGSFIKELKKVTDISWAAVALIEDDSLYFLALSSEIGSAWKVGKRVPIKGTATEWVVTHRETMVESDLSQESQFVMSESYHKQGVRSIAHLPLIAKGRGIGSLIVASRYPSAYSHRHIMLLEQLASQIAMPIENSRLYAELQGKVRVDELTGLLNRRSLDEVMASEISRHSRYGGGFSLIILDLDSFKAFNDNYGHLAGDELLTKTGSFMKNSIRSADQAFRYGGDEFAILLPNTSIDAANQVAERIRKQITSKVIVGHISVTTSLGVANWPANGRGANDVIAAADAALYHAKRSGGNQSHCAENPERK